MLYLIRSIRFIYILCLTGTPGQDHTDEQKKKVKTECIAYFNDSEHADSLKSKIDIENVCDCIVEKIYAGFSEGEIIEMEQKEVNKMFILKIVNKINPCIIKELEEH